MVYIYIYIKIPINQWGFQEASMSKHAQKMFTAHICIELYRSLYIKKKKKLHLKTIIKILYSAIRPTPRL